MSSHCHDEHTHSHSHSGEHDHGHGHDHSEDLTPAIQNLLYAQIAFDNVRVLNEADAGSGRAVLRKPWNDRLTAAPELCSDADEQFLVHVPFTGQVRLHAVLLRTSDSPSAPRTLRLHANAEDLDFDTAEGTRPTQTLELARSSEIQEVPVRRALFASCRHLALFFADNYGDDISCLTYLAFKGDFMRLNREPVEVLYESAARPTDHKVEGAVSGVGMGSGIGGGRQGY